MSELLVGQRAAVAEGRLAALLTISLEQEEAGARLATLEQRRVTLQAVGAPVTIARDLHIRTRRRPTNAVATADAKKRNR